MTDYAAQVRKFKTDSEFFRLGSLTPEDSAILAAQPMNGIATHLSDDEVMTYLTRLGNLPPAVKITLLELADLS